MLLPLLGSAAAGGLIGYGTNWLAIRMLFWPLEEKRLFGLKIPFTPGLIPKKRGKLATALGDTVAEHLVTQETLLGALAAPELKAQIAAKLQLIWETEAHKTFSLLLADYGLKASCSRWQSALWQAAVRSLRQTSPAGLTGTAGDDLAAALFAAVIGQFRQSGWQELQQIGASLQADEQWQAALTRLLEQVLAALGQKAQPLALVLPPDTKEKLRQLVLAQTPDWLDRLQQALETEASRNVIKRLIKQVLAGNPMLKLVAAFADLDRLAGALPALLAKEEVRTELCTIALDWIDRAFDLPVNQLLTKLFPKGVTPTQAAQWSQRLWQLDLPRAWLTSPNWQALPANVGQLLLPFRPLLQHLWQGALADQQVLLSLRGLYDRALARLLDASLASLLPTVTTATFTAWSGQICQWLTDLVAKHGQALLGSLRLPEVVSAQVNNMEMVEVEEILLRVMREQLRAITNLGFLLGAAVGLILPSFNNWLSGF